MERIKNPHTIRKERGTEFPTLWSGLYRSKKHQGVLCKELSRSNPAVGDLFENQGHCRVLRFFSWIFSFKKSTVNPQHLIRLSNDSVSQLGDVQREKTNYEHVT